MKLLIHNLLGEFLADGGEVHWVLDVLVVFRELLSVHRGQEGPSAVMGPQLICRRVVRGIIINFKCDEL